MISLDDQMSGNTAGKCCTTDRLHHKHKYIHTVIDHNQPLLNHDHLVKECLVGNSNRKFATSKQKCTHKEQRQSSMTVNK